MRRTPVVMAVVLLTAPATTHMAVATEAADTRPILANARGRVETTDARATGRLVRVDAGGNRTSNAFAIKAHWFPGVLRVLLEISPSKTPVPNAREDARMSVLLEMRPGGGNMVRISRPHEVAPASLPFAQWSDGVAGSDFDYEDFLQPEYYWKNQTFVKTARLGAHDCDVWKSTPSAAERSHYAEVETWFDHTSGYPLYAEKTLKDGAVVKDFTSLGVGQSGGVAAARQVEVKIQGRPGSTLLIFERGSTKANLTLKDFSPEQISKFEDRP